VKPLRRIWRAPGTPYGRLALAGLLGLASAAATIGLLAGSGYVIGRAALHPGLGALVGILAAVEVLAFLRGPLRYAERLIGHDAALRALAQWRVWLYDCLTPRVPAALAGWRSGDLLTRAIDDVDTLQDLYLRTMLPLGVAFGAALLGLVVVGLALPVAVLALGIPLLVAVIVPPALVWRAAADEEGTALSGEIAAHVVDIIHGAPDLLAFGADVDALDRLDEMSRTSESLARGQSRSAALAAAVTQLCAGAAATAVLAVAVTAVHAHHLNPVMVAVLPLAALGTFEPVPGVTMAVSRALAVRAAARRLLALEAVPVPVGDPEVARSLPGGVPDVSFDLASLRYAPELPLALDDVTLHLAPGDRVAVTGSSGAGKSSLVNALLRFWPLESGRLRLGGIATDELTQSDVRAACALVDQRAQMFAGTLRSNVTLGRPDATDAEIGSALDASQLSTWVAALPAGLDTPVGEDGVSISGGERRRLAVARALLAGGPVLLLDEPTAGLDPQQADQLIDDVLAAAAERSVLLITHRAAEADRCHRTVSLDGGRIATAAREQDGR
jgi:ATP-binding cassette subfamily C protein CydC